jgi:hypothetical protein
VLLVRLAGTKPTACHIVSVERSLTDVEPPAFVARLSMDIRARCRPDPVPYEVHQAFRVGLRREGVVVHHGGGQLDVPVEDVSPQTDSTEGLRPVSGTGGLPVFDIGAEPGEAVGYSRAYDLGEAIREAIDKLPTQGANIPDWLSTYTVLSIGAEIGGIAGFNHLKVRVSG